MSLLKIKYDNSTANVIYKRELFFVMAVMIGALCDIAVVNFAGLNLRLPTVAIISYIALYFQRIKETLLFFKKHNWWIILFSSYMFCLFLPVYWCNIPLLVIKQLILIMLLHLNIIFFASLKSSENKLSIGILYQIMVVSIIVNVYAFLKPLWYLYAGKFNITMVRPSAFFNQESVNVLGQAHVMIMAYIIGCLLYRPLPSKLKWYAVVALGFMLPIFIVANNRASYIAIFVQLIIIPTLLFKHIRRKIFKVVALSTVIILISIALLPLTKNLPPIRSSDESFYDFITERFTGMFEGNNFGGDSSDEFEGSIQVRVDGYRVALKQFEEHPFFGVGLANTAAGDSLQGAEAGSSFASTVRQSSENMFVDVFAETGLIGIYFFIIYYGFIIYRAYKNVRLAENTNAFPLAVGSLLAVCGMLINGLSVSPLTQHFFWINIGIIFFLWEKLSSQRDANSVRSRMPINFKATENV